MTKEDANLSAAVRSIRTRLGKNLQQFADMVGVNVGTISRYESGARRPNFLPLTKLFELAVGVERNPLIKEIEIIFAAQNLTERQAEQLIRGHLKEARTVISDELFGPSPRPNLDRFSYFSSSISAERCEVDSSLADIVQCWYDSDVSSEAVRAAFADAATFLRVKLTTLQSATPPTAKVKHPRRTA